MRAFHKSNRGFFVRVVKASQNPVNPPAKSLMVFLIN